MRPEYLQEKKVQNKKDDYLEYKRICKEVSANIKCIYKNIGNMNSIELNNYIHELLRLKNHSRQCYIKRLEFQKKWIPEEDRDY